MKIAIMKTNLDRSSFERFLRFLLISVDLGGFNSLKIKT